MKSFRLIQFVLIGMLTLFTFTLSCGRVRNDQDKTEIKEKTPTPTPTPALTYTVSGTLAGINGTLVVTVNDDEELELSADGAFTFTTKLNNGATYEVEIQAQPSTQTCTLTNPSGTIAAADVSNVAIVCAVNTYTVGGTISGLTAGKSAVLKNSNDDELTVSSNGSFTFDDRVADGASYAVVVLTQPTGLICSAQTNSGTIAGANVTTVSVVCSATSYTIGGTLSGLGASKTVVLQNNAGDSLTLTSNGAFTFATPAAENAAYSVSVLTQPSSQVCSITSASGTATANVTSVSVSCVDTYSIGGTASGLGGGKSVVLQNNNGDNLTVNSNAAFTFSTRVTGAYSVTVHTQPVEQTCVVGSGSGTASADVTSVTITCTDNTYTVGGSVAGLNGGESVSLQNNLGNTTVINSNGSYTFSTSLSTGQMYSVTVSSHPLGQRCSVANPSGTIAGANVSNVTVTCTTNLKIFVSAASSTGQFGSMANMDAFCNADGNKPGGGSTYKALAVDGSTRIACTTNNCVTNGALENVNWVLAASRAYSRSSDLAYIGTTNSSGIFSFPLSASISTAADLVWTGLNSTWRVQTHCAGWTSPNVADTGTYGTASATNVTSIVTNLGTCDTPRRLICVEQ